MAIYASSSTPGAKVRRARDDHGGDEDELVIALFKNRRPDRAASDPEFRGHVNFNGKRLQGVGWQRIGKTGEAYLEIRLRARGDEWR